MLEALRSGKQAVNPFAPERIAIPETAVEVWLARLDLAPEHVAQCADLLSADEQVRAQRFHFEHDSRRFTVARAMLRMLLGKYLMIDGRTIQFTRTEKGKPLIADAAAHFNISHSQERALIAISRTRPVGVDIEYLKRQVNHQALAARYFAPGEYAAIQGLPEPERKRAFFTCWTCKEAIAKASGEGLFLSLNSFEVLTPPGFTLSRRVNGYALYETATDNDYIAAVAEDQRDGRASSAS